MRGDRPESRLQEERLLERLREEPLRPVYWFYGKETFFVERCAAAIRARVVPAADLSDVLVQVFHGSDATPDEVFAAARTPPFFHDRQMLLVREADKLRDARWEKTGSYLERPAPFSCLVFLGGDALPKDPSFPVQRALGVEACIGFPALAPAQRRAWVKRIAKEKGVEARVTPDVLAGFLEEGYVPLSRIEARLEMLALYYHGGPHGGDGPLEPPPGWSSGELEKGYLLTDALLDGNAGDALALLKRFLDQGTAPLVILSRIAWEIRRVVQLQEARRGGQTPEAAVRSAGIRSAARQRYLSLSDRMAGGVAADRLLASLLDADRALKSSRANPQWHLEELCVSVVRSLRGR